jgi:hypothetical protein
METRLVNHSVGYGLNLFAKLMQVNSLWLGLSLSSLETAIIATALVTISSDFGHCDKSSWIVVSYFLTYTGKSRAAMTYKFLLNYPRIDGDIYKNERYFRQKASSACCCRLLHRLVIGMWGFTKYRGAVRTRGCAIIDPN